MADPILPGAQAPDGATQIRPRIVCRPIAPEDLARVADLLTRGFPSRPRTYWQTALQRMARLTVPEGCERFGYLLVIDTEPVGVLLLIASARSIDGEQRIFCNVSSWYVDQRFIAYAPALVSKALRNRALTYVNISPSPPTWPILEIQGYRKYCLGSFWTMAWFRPAARDVRLTVLRAGGTDSRAARETDWPLLRDHAEFGCLVLLCCGPTEISPFVFRPYRRRDGKLWMPAAQLIYCRDYAGLVRHAGILSRYLALRGMPFIIADANGPLAGLPGFYQSRWGTKFYRGSKPPVLGDLAYTECALFGF
jgi:hypothetical protein